MGVTQAGRDKGRGESGGGVNKHLSELNAAMPKGHKVVYDKTSHEYVALNLVVGEEVLRRPAATVDSWRRGNRGAVMATALKHEARRRGKTA